MKAGDAASIKATVLRVDEESNRVDLQTPNGQLIQTDASNVSVDTPEEPIVLAGGAIEHNAKKAGQGRRNR